MKQGDKVTYYGKNYRIEHILDNNPCYAMVLITASGKYIVNVPHNKVQEVKAK